jgi:hypothetical protein
MKTISSLISVAFLLTITNCKKTYDTVEWEVDPESGQAIVVGINDTSIYMFDPSNRKMRFIVNSKNIHNGYFFAQMNNDTIELGESFEGMVRLMKYNALIKIESPIDTAYNAVEQGVIDNFSIPFTPTKTGVYEFKGHVQFDSAKFLIYYKFITVDKGQRTARYNYAGKIKRSYTPTPESEKSRKKEKRTIIKGNFFVSYYDTPDSARLGINIDPGSDLYFISPKIRRIGNSDNYIIVERQEFHPKEGQPEIVYFIVDMKVLSRQDNDDKDIKFIHGPYYEIHEFELTKERLGIKDLQFTKEF